MLVTRLRGFVKAMKDVHQIGQSVPIAGANFCANVCVSMTVACRSELFSSLVIRVRHGTEQMNRPPYACCRQHSSWYAAATKFYDSKINVNLAKHYN
jgi:hypothetical protein